MGEETKSKWSEETWTSELILTQLRVRARLVERLAEKLQHGEDFPTDTPPKLCELVRLTAKIVGDNLEKAPPDGLKHVNYFLCEIAKQLRYVERSKIEQTPWSMIQATEDFFKNLVGTNCHFIIRPQWAYNYGIVGEFSSFYQTLIEGLDWIDASEWEKALCEAKIKNLNIYCISFPRVERLNGLLHTSWGHEIGHIFAGRWVKANFEFLWRSEEADIKAAIDADVRKNPPPPVDSLFRELFIQHVVSEKLDKCMQAVRQGITELICDSIGVHLFGPAALAAACEFSAPFSLDRSPLELGMYPPWRYRIRQMFNYLKEDLEQTIASIESGSSLCQKKLVGPYVKWLLKIENLVNNKKDLVTLKGNVITSEAYRVINEKWGKIRNEMLSLLPENFVTPYMMKDAIDEIAALADNLDGDIPPNEIGEWPDTEPARFEDILNAAWAFKESKRDYAPEWGEVDEAEMLYRLVLKAVEASFVHNKYGGKVAEIG